MPDDTDASGVGYGGALSIYGSAKLNITKSAFSGNIADKGGGAIHFSGNNMDVADATFNGNLVTDEIPTTVPDSLRGGGAIYLDANAVLNVQRAAFDGNLSWVAPAGAIFVAINSTAVVADSSFNANIAGTPLNGQSGGAIYNTETLTVTRSAFYLNIATSNGGAVANDRGGNARLFNTTLAGNVATGNGGAIWNTNTQSNNIDSFVTAYNVTFSDNNAVSGSAIYNDTSDDHLVYLANTILNKGIGVTDPCNTALTSQGHNIDSGASCGLGGSGDQSNTDPMLDTLNFNGGPIFSLLSMKLQAGSPGLDAGDGAICSSSGVGNKDQRGKDRPQDGSGDGNAACDIGAVENDGLKAGYGSTPVQPGPIHVGNSNFGVPVDTSFTVFETGNHTLEISSASLGGPDAAQFAVITAMPQSIADGDAPIDLMLRCTPTGPVEGLRTAQLTLATNDPDHASVVYDLTCNGTTLPVPGFSSDPIPPGPLDFGPAMVGSSTTKTIQVFETGNADLTLSSSSIQGANPGDFLLATGLPVTVMNGTPGINLSVECNPQDYGARTASLTLQTNDPLNPSVTFNLVCEGTLPPPPVLEGPGQSLGGGGIPALNNPYGAAISPDGRYVYAAGYTSDSIEVYERDLVTGQLSFRQSLGDPDSDLDGVWMLIISEDGKQLYAASFNADAVVVFDRDPQLGYLTKSQAVHEGDGYGCFPGPCDGFVTGLDGAYGLALSPDGRYLYVSGVSSDGILVLWRGTDGSIRSLLGGVHFVQSYLDPARLDGAYGIAVSPDGNHLYATGYASDTLVVLDRNNDDGHIAYSEAYSAAGIPGLNGVFRVTLSPDGLNVYTSSYDGDALTAFRRNPIDGLLEHSATYTDGVDGLTTLNAVTSAAVSPDGKYLFATSYLDAALTVFARDPLTGLLTFVQALVRDSGTGLPALDGARHVAVSSDGRMVVATGYLDSKVNAFLMANPTPLLESLTPASVVEGSPDFTLTLYGQDFVYGVEVLLNGTPLATTRVGDTELQVTIGAADVSSAGTLSLRASNPAPGGGQSNELQFTVTAVGDNPVPAISSLIPQGASAGDPGLMLQIMGNGFMPASVVQWNGQDRSTTYINANEVQISVSAADIAQPGAAGLRVLNPAPGGGTSNAVLFEIAAPGENPPPSVLAISPDWIFSRGAASPGFELVVTGSNFVEGAQVLWNGDPLPTDFISANELHAVVNASQLSWPGTASISVYNPAPGGGTSNALTFIIRQLNELFLPTMLR
jgi:6-phosphogluconolactonase (cycloisomerase 2 family)